jgi:stress-induced morphogen
MALRVRMRGLEPPRPEGHTDLNRARLPIPPHPPIPESSEPAATIREPESRRYHRAVSTEPIRALLENAFPDAAELHVIDRGGGDHLEVRIAAAAFNGLSRVEQHKLVYAALAEPWDAGSIHELRINTAGTAT